MTFCSWLKYRPTRSGTEQLRATCALLTGSGWDSEMQWHRHLNWKISMEECVIPRKYKSSQLGGEALFLLQSERPKEMGLISVKYILFEWKFLVEDVV